MIAEVLDHPDINDAQRSLEERFKSCKAKVKASNPKASEFAICAYLNPTISASRRAELKSKMAAARSK